MSKIFDTFDVDYNSVSFRYTASGVKEHVFVDKPDGIGVTQWTDFWECVKELYDDGRSLEEILDETESDELAELRKSNDELEDLNDALRSEVRKLELDNDNLDYSNKALIEENQKLQQSIWGLKAENDSLEYDVAELKARIAELEK